MKSQIVDAIRLSNHPVGISFTDEKPQNALTFKPDRWACMVALYAAVAQKGKTAAFDRQATGCQGAVTGLCFGSAYGEMPGGINAFLSTGSEHREGERYKKTPELAGTYVDSLPIADMPEKYAVFRPLGEIPEGDPPALISFLVNPDQLSALSVLANFGRKGQYAVLLPFGSACSSICLLPYHQGAQSEPQAVVGLIDVTARPLLPADKLAFTVPYSMFVEMELNVDESFLRLEGWKKLSERIGD